MIFSNKAALLVAMVITATLAVPAVGQPERGIEVGNKVEPRQVRTIEREKITLPAEEGLTVLLFWSTWSPRSSSAIDIWQKYGEDYKENGVTVLSVNADNQRMDEADIKSVREYIAENEVTLPVILDKGLELFNEIGVIVLPTTLIFKPDGTLDYKYAGLPTSAAMDLKEDLEAKLGITREPTAEEDANRGKLAYQPKNNALLFYNMGKRLREKGFPEKAKAKHLESLQRDLEYEGPLRALEGIFFVDGRTPETEERLRALLTASGLKEIIGNISEEGDVLEGDGIADSEGSAAEDVTQAPQVPAPAVTPEAKKLTPMERMKLLMEEK